jgi:hypothetical protein
LLLVDTLPKWTGLQGDRENNSGDALAAVEPLQRLAVDLYMGVAYDRHDRKSGGDIGDSGRGSSAFAGAADILLTLARVAGQGRPTIRELKGIGRLPDIPERLLVERTSEGYVVLNEAANKIAETARRMIGVLPPDPTSAMTREDLFAKAGEGSYGTKAAAIKQLEDTRVVAVSGTGKKGDPFRYSLTKAFLSETPDIGLTETNLDDEADE